MQTSTTGYGARSSQPEAPGPGSPGPWRHGTLVRMRAEAKNFEAITKAKADHNRHCPFPPHTVRMNPFEIERMGWEEGDIIAGLTLEADPKLGTGAFRLVCDGMEPPELDIEEETVIEAPEPLVVPAGPLRETEPRS
jgi:hypothetical protein